MEKGICKDSGNNKSGKTHVNEDDVSSVRTDIPSDPWLDDQDINCCAPFQNSNKKTETYNENVSLFYNTELEESNLKDNEIDLYNDLVMVEDEEKRSKHKHDNEVENLKKELEKLRESDANKSMKISELIKENTNLKKSICSLYQTVKSEIELKDQLLAEANRKVDAMLFRKNSQNFRTDTKISSSNNVSDTSNQNSYKRKRSTEHQNEMENESSLRNSKNSDLRFDKRTKCASDRSDLKFKYNGCQTFEKNSNQNITLQAPETSENCKDSTETNNLFYSMIPIPLKKAFHEYEQSQIISLNKLKQAYINEYYSADKHSISNSEFTSKRASSQNTFSHNHNSVNSSYLTENDKTVANHKNNVESNCKITTSMQKDLVSLFKYRKERIPFLSKRKFDLLKDGKALIPEDLL